MSIDLQGLLNLKLKTLQFFEEEPELANEKIEIFEMENAICEEFNPVGLDDEQSAFSIKSSFFHREDFFRGD